MRDFILTTILFAFSQSTYAQIDSSKLFGESKGKWTYPISEICRLDCFENYKNRTEHHYDHKTMFFYSKKNTTVNAVHSGEVLKVLLVDDMYFIIVKYGRYFIGYFGITNPRIKEKEIIDANQVIGELAKGLDEEYSLELTLNYNQQEIDPSSWFNQKNCP